MFSRYDNDKRPKWLRWFLFEVPSSATGEWWDRREDMLRRRAPVRYALQHDLPIIIKRQKHRLNDAWWKVRHRTTDRYNIVKTGLKPGYYEINDRMLHALFALLVEYVEIGLSSKNYGTELKDPKARGLEYLDWEINDPNCAGPQAETAATAKELYLWWTVERPARLDSWSSPEIWPNRQTDERKSSFVERLVGMRFGRKNRLRLSMKQPKEEREAGDLARKLEEFYDFQDTEMLVRLAGIRRGLWT